MWYVWVNLRKCSLYNFIVCRRLFERKVFFWYWILRRIGCMIFCVVGIRVFISKLFSCGFVEVSEMFF